MAFKALLTEGKPKSTKNHIFWKKHIFEGVPPFTLIHSKGVPRQFAPLESALGIAEGGVFFKTSLLSAVY